jgi:AraC-like DNA-binding protein/mannose-6-phosphate isomerase-like protein (cupin superfamily)
MDTLTVLPDQSEVVRYADPAFPVYLRENRLSDYPYKRVLCHWHPDFEFFYVEEGSPSYFVNGETVRLKTGECLFVNSKAIHYGFSEDGEDSRYLCLIFPASLLAPSPLFKNRYFDPLEEDASLPYIVFDPVRAEGLSKELRFLYGLLQKKEADPFLFMEHLYSFFGVFLSLKGQERAIGLPSNGKTALVKKMLAYLYAHYAEALSVEDLATAAAISSSYALHLFKEFLHASPIQYLLSYRLEKATELLQENEKDITEIAQAIGFESPAYFSELFHREKGCSPKAYRARFLKKEKA